MHWGRVIGTICLSIGIGGCHSASQTAPTLPPTGSHPPTLVVQNQPLSTPLPAATQPPAPEISVIPPTPLVYIVQEGETFAYIARRFGVDMQQLQAVNGGIEPRNLQIGQQLLIPNPLFDPAGYPIFPTPLPRYTAIPPPQCTILATETMYCLGSVPNSTRQLMTQVRVHVRAYQANGALLAEGANFISQAIIPLGNFSPYHVRLKGEWNAFANAAAWVEYSAPPSTPYSELLTQSPEWSAGGLRVRVYNPSGQTVYAERAVISFFDSRDQLSNYRVLPLNLLFASGQEKPLSLPLSPPAYPPRYHLYIEGRATANT